MGENSYAAQARGGLDDYGRYLAGMDASMRQKVALTAAHLLCEGQVADMGMGSGTGSVALASLYPRLQVVGVDVDATIVALARASHVRPNLSFQQGDIARPVFPPGSLDGIFDSSVLHHVTSYGGYRHANAEEALRVQVAQLKPGGVLVVRDFLDPGPAHVLLDLPDDDGANEGAAEDVRALSSAALLQRFAREFRSLSPAPGFPLEDVPPSPGLPCRAGWRRFRLPHKLAAEFVLRKDYRADWATEVQEEYTYYTQAQFEVLFARLGLRVLASTPLWNPWIVRRRFAGRFELRDGEGRPLEFPATNYVIVGENVASGQGVRFQVVPSGAADQPPSGRPFLGLEAHRDRESGRIFDLAYRPHPTVDVVPFFVAAGVPYILARTGYPRPILRAGREDTAPLDGSGPADYITEPLNVLQTEAPLGRTVEDALANDAGITADHIRRMLPGTTYYPSPGGILEEVRSVLVEIDPLYVNAPLEGRSAFSSSGRVRAIEARQLLRAAQVGGLPDARLELNAHDLLLRLQIDRGPWIGEEITLAASPARTPVALADLQDRPRRRRFDRVSAGGGRFLEIRAAEFAELTAEGHEVARARLEWVAPRPLGANTVAVALLAPNAAGRPLLALDQDDLPAAQCFAGVSDLLVAPAWRLPREVSSRSLAEAFIRQRLLDEYGLTTGACWELGGPYRPSPGLTPEVVHPLAFQALDTRAGGRALQWVLLQEVIGRRASLPDGHLRVLALRASHALSVT
jgi:SAM-dependent methyltransferase